VVAFVEHHGRLSCTRHELIDGWQRQLQRALFGTAADLSIRDASGAHSCAVWNQIAVAAGAWVDPVGELVQR
jgi:hypothetical protein